MLYVYLDESYNLKDRTKPQFISINGFTVFEIKNLFKKWKKYRHTFIGRRRIHATDSAFNNLRLKAMKLIRRHDLTLLTVFQVIQELPLKKDKSYFRKGKLDFEKIYLDLLKTLFNELHLEEYKSVTIIVDARKHKAGILGKENFKKEIMQFFDQKYSETEINFELQPSTTNILLELADFISNIFYRAYIRNDMKFFEDLRFKIAQIKNPL